ncbi:hypothetical protein B0H63DRAFT_554801 [Podospora didyma]|uniref:Uncharacterized protein n=1 Tax=Podospora didyma TaxID=330526 RepID=A0AAE0U7H6_9PEZI|nr:hypothetical protein B0H63DRAFT_554801 [Podospora didyma]
MAHYGSFAPGGNTPPDIPRLQWPREKAARVADLREWTLSPPMTIAERILRPGESWNTSCVLLSEGRFSSLPADIEVGDVFRYRFKGASAVWWVWGHTDHEHAQTIARLDRGRKKVLLPIG